MFLVCVSYIILYSVMIAHLKQYVSAIEKKSRLKANAVDLGIL